MSIYDNVDEYPDADPRLKEPFELKGPDPDRLEEARRQKTKSQSLYDKVATSKRTHTTLKFPLDLDADGNQNIIRFNVSLPSGSKYLANGDYQKATDPETGQTQSSDYRSNQQRGSIGRRFSQNYTRTTSTIDLYMPPQIQTSYQSEWNASELGVLGAGIDAWNGLFNNDGMGAAAKQAWETIKQSSGSMMANTLAGAIQAITPVNAKDAKSFAQSSTSNPYMEVIFNGVQHRTFSFTFKMIPRNRFEQEDIRRIVQEFKFHSAPEYKFGNQNLYMRFPSEFDITFIHKNTENPWLFKISTCALTNVSVNHSPEGQYAAHADGAPFATELTLEFTELVLLSKEDHKMGY